MTSILAAMAAVALIPSSQAEEEHHHHEAKIAGPNGGRVITVVEPHVEFFRRDDGKVQITSVDDEGKAQAWGTQIISVTGGERAHPAKLTFTREGEVLVSDQAFPEGKSLPVVVSIQSAPDEKAVYERFKLNLANCPGCEHAEYACTCEHEH
ncbi:hypothetical protein HNR46_001094 [Haloferula luteola]|uniref:Uncharacterized protein n=1 Tax=Haloferula luteola TaxID=595692 RepID=A0A840VA88_9BACT|nr:hypothetical protein [Haloferula luteola]MBB5350860.1 hypothetical protein [Haloferula luteola]